MEGDRLACEETPSNMKVCCVCGETEDVNVALGVNPRSTARRNARDRTSHIMMCGAKRSRA